MSRETAGASIRVFRARVAWSQGDLAREAGCSTSQVSRIESGEVSRPDPDVISAMLRAFRGAGLDDAQVGPWWAEWGAE